MLSATYRQEIPYRSISKSSCLAYSRGFYHFLFFVAHVDYRKAIQWGYIGYIVVIALLAFTIIKGSIGMGLDSWIDLAFIKVQPSEIVKLFFPAFTTYYFYTYRGYFSRDWRDYVPIIIPLIISTILVLKQPDLGTAIVLFFFELL